MSKQRKLFFAMAGFAMLCALGAGCAPKKRYTRPRVQRPTRVEVGMTKVQVESVLGRPHDYAADGDSEIWRYYKKDGDRVLSMTVVRFRQDLVQSFDTNVQPPRTLPEQKPVLRPAPGPSPHHGAPAREPARGGSHGHTAAPDGHGGSGDHGAAPRKAEPARRCAKHSDCARGQRCAQGSTGAMICQ